MTRTRRFVPFLTLAVLAAAAPLAAQKGPAPAVDRLPADIAAMACAPTVVFATPKPSLLVTGGQDAFTHHSYGPGSLITINGGSDNGIEVGQQYYVRRPQPERFAAVSRNNPATIRTAGWVRVYAIDKRMSLVTVVHACDAIDVGDYLEPFVLPQFPTADADPPPPQKENYGHILLGTDRRASFAKDDFFVIDRGSDHGVTVGERVIIYRDKGRMEASSRTATNNLPKDIVPEFLYELGEAVVVEVKPEISTVRAITARDALFAGDYVALRKAPR